MEANTFELGPNILENLTTGMYSDSKVIYREYIQNACDQIDKAVEMGILNSREDGRVDIYIDVKRRSVSVEDNATGISEADFYHTLMDIANSAKILGKDKGFRGIGRMAGLAYCNKLVFKASAAGESKKSVLIFDAKKIREYIAEHLQKKNHTLKDVWIGSSEYHVEKEDVDKHYFKVELIGITQENRDLLDQEIIKRYLSFTAPVPYNKNFYPGREVKKYAERNGFSLDEYKVHIDGIQIFKRYTMEYDTHGKGKDYVKDLVYKIFTDGDRPIAWCWLGISNFKGSLPPSVAMRGIRLRAANIQIGDDDIMQRFFKDSEKRGAYYFLGEIHVVSKDLIPNSQRDYFNENQERVVFESEMNAFAKELTPIYHAGSKMNGDIKALEKAQEEARSFQQKQRENKFINAEDVEDAQQKLEVQQEKAVEARKNLEKIASKADTGFTSSVIKRIAENRVAEFERKKTVLVREDGIELAGNEEKKKEKKRHRTDNLTSLSKKDKKLIEKVYQGIKKALDGQDELIEKVIKAVEDELK